MPLVAEQLLVPFEDPNTLSRSLAELLEFRWTSYRKALKRCRKRFSEKSVHTLRVEIRRMLSALALLSAVLPPDSISPLGDEFKDRLKALSRLRDTHVQIDTIEDLLAVSPELEPFHAWLRRRARRLTGRVERELAQVRLSKAARLISELKSSLGEAAGRLDESGGLQPVLVEATGRAFEDVRAHCRKVSAEDVDTVHRTRLAFKKFRYMVEALAKVLPGFTERQLKAMQAYQTRMGKIQDVDVLLKRADKFVKKTDLNDLFFDAFRQNLLRKRARLVRLYLRSANELTAFWPPDKRPSGRRRRGGSSAPKRGGGGVRGGGRVVLPPSR